MKFIFTLAYAYNLSNTEELDIHVLYKKKNIEHALQTNISH